MATQVFACISTSGCSCFGEEGDCLAVPFSVPDGMGETAPTLRLAKPPRDRAAAKRHTPTASFHAHQRLTQVAVPEACPPRVAASGADLQQEIVILQDQIAWVQNQRLLLERQQQLQMQLTLVQQLRLRNNAAASGPTTAAEQLADRPASRHIRVEPPQKVSEVLRIAETLKALDSYDPERVLRVSRLGRLSANGLGVLERYLEDHYGPVLRLLPVAVTPNRQIKSRMSSMCFVVMATVFARNAATAQERHEILPGHSISIGPYSRKTQFDEAK